MARPLSIRGRILLFQLVGGGAVLLMTFLVYLAYRSFDFYVERSTWSREQLDEITELDSRANRYSEQIAELLLIGDAERSDYRSAQAEFEASLSEWGNLIRGERAFVDGSADAGPERVEVDRFRRVTELFAETNAEVERLYAIRQAGRQDDAVRQFRREVENRLDANLEEVVAEAVDDEVDEVLQADAQVARTMQNLVLVAAGTLLVALAAIIGFGAMLYRSLAQPIQRLTDGAIAIGRGDLSYRVGALGGDELGLLAARFDAMAGQLAEQRGLLDQARLHLEREVRERTAELEAANRRLRELDELRVRFLADISHELRTPLTVLRGEAEVTLRGREVPESFYRETLARIVEQASDMGRLVQDLLFLARAEGDAIRFERELVDLHGLAEDALRDAIVGRGTEVSVKTDLSNAPVLVEGDRQRLKQILLIILDNAIKYSDRDSPVLLRLAKHDDEAVITVRNRCQALSADDLPNVFDRFYRGRTSDERAAGGAGLGLPIARWIAEMHGGSIALTSPEPNFIEACFRMPAIGVAAVADAGRVKRLAGGDHGEDSAGRGRLAHSRLRQARA